MNATFFATALEFRAWLRAHHTTSTELVVGIYKRGSGRGGITYAEALDEALCYGWIDAVRRSIDDVSYSIRFTPRKPGSIWSNINTKRVAELIADGRMKPSGLEAFEKRRAERAGTYAYEQTAHALDPAYEKKFKAKKKAWAFFEKQAAWYQRNARWWVMSAKREETRVKRLEQLIADSGDGLWIAHLRRPGTAAK